MSNEKGFSVGDALGFGWRMFKDNLGFWAFYFLVAIVVAIVPAMIQGGMAEQGAPEALVLLMVLIGWVLNMWVSVFLVRSVVLLGRGETPQKGMVLDSGRYLIGFILGSILYVLAIGVGLLLLIFPGIYMALHYWYWPMHFVDENLGVIDSFKASAATTTGAKWDLFALYLLTIILMFLSVFTLGLAFFIVVPVTSVAYAYGYHKLKAQVAQEA